MFYGTGNAIRGNPVISGSIGLEMKRWHYKHTTSQISILPSLLLDPPVAHNRAWNVRRGAVES